ncbi:MAG TPA: ATP-binding protein [Mucilaginibacter sp.]|jgi:signal transduction histidine kinase|nr:ATP-binding protein [Mucilaginibacter sp.]
MKIKNRLSLYFTLTSAVIFFIAMVIIYITFTSLVKTDFFNRLFDRAKVASELYLKADELSADSLDRVRTRYFRQIPGEIIRIYDSKNAASFIKDKEQYWGNNIIAAVRKKKEIEFNEGEHQTVGVYFNDNQGNFVVLVSAIDIQGNKRLSDLVEIMSVLFLIVIFGLFLISRWFAKKALEPIDDVVEQMQLVRASNLSMRISEGNGKDEISRLAQNFNRLLKHLENTFELQQSFVTNASHELRTPVTSIIGEIEVALNKSRTSAEYEQLLVSVLGDAARLKETITGLLELAQVDINYTQAILTPVAIDDLIWELNDYWLKKEGKSRFTVNIIRLPEDPDLLLVAANKALLLIALNNIIGNAYKFSDDKPVRCELYADDRIIRIAIIDEGVGIPADEQEKIFESFYRATNVKDYYGSGIGLYVTGKIISLFNGTIRINSSTGKGTTVIVEFAR